MADLIAALRETFKNIVENKKPPPPEEDGNTSRECLYIALATAGGCAFFRRVILPAILRQFEATRCPSPEKANQWGSYALSFIHALWFASWSQYRLGWPPRLRPKTTDARRTCAITAGYFLEDSWSTRHEWTTKSQYAVHHALTLGMSAMTLWNTGFTRFVYLWGLVEWSTVWLDIMWFVRTVYGEQSRAFKPVALTFVTTFFVCRMVWMPAVWIAVHKQYPDVLAKFGVTKLFYNLCLVLQAWWFVVIIQNLRSKLA